MNLGIACLLLAACGGKKDATPAAGSAAVVAAGSAAPASARAGTPAGKCTFTVTGDFTLTVDAVATKSPPNGKAMATADYWQTDDQIRSALQMISNLGKKSKDEVTAEVDAAMKKDPKFMLLLINCGADAGSLNFGPGKDSKYADFPFKAGSYPIAVGNGKAGELGVMINLRPPTGHESFQVSEPGSMNITKFDATGITGTFTFKAKSHHDKSIEVTGSFDYPCVGVTCKS
ncbi:MAG: hypothetical protein ABI591_18840 [Kofleriaceae bacterium]